MPEHQDAIIISPQINKHPMQDAQARHPKAQLGFLQQEF